MRVIDSAIASICRGSTVRKEDRHALIQAQYASAEDAFPKIAARE
jgi:hypothetical protein